MQRKKNSLTIVKVEKQNTAQKGKISVRKTGDIFTSVNMASSAYTDENGELVVNSTTYTPVFADGDLSGAVFQVIAVEDIVTLDGTTKLMQEMLFQRSRQTKTAMPKLSRFISASMRSER